MTFAHSLLVLAICWVSWLTSATEATLRSYNNPIIPGFAPDPSCIRVGPEYYCVTSSFSAFPGVPVYASKDLVSWRQIGNVFSRPEQLPAFGSVNSSTSGIWAATIRHTNGTFYVTTTLVFDGAPFDDPSRWKNVLFTTDDIYAQNGNGWSDPIFFDFPGYDTSLFWDDDGKVYVQGSHAWRVFPAIQQYEIDIKTGASLSGDPVTLWTGTGGLAKGPHIYKKDGFYHLLIAEGGTGVGHMVTMARAMNVNGPYEPYTQNPVFTSANTTDYLQTVGHADLFQDTNGNWWSVALATRNATVNYPMGRETIMVPATWPKGEYPIFNSQLPGRVQLDMKGPLPASQPPPRTTPGDILVGQNEHLTFSKGSSLPRQFVYYRYPDFSAFKISPPGHPNALQIMGSAENITGPTAAAGTSTFITRRQDHVEFVAEVTLDFKPKVDGEEAGMTLFIQRRQHFDLGVVALSGGQRFIRLRTITASSTNEGQTDPISRPNIIPLGANLNPLRLQVNAVNASTYLFSYSEDEGKTWHLVGSGAASQVSGGFTGTLVGMFATGNGKNSTTPAYFCDFEYTVDPLIY
ncbi:hypothetical protein BDN72DRAFT_762060 [Pluteus cervinus]|uniref:Uncharacterized protein n=1 Tax=Pluteus cervinus TaxID=181527 RepID=A0ACD3B6E7_9AGAR|nr:hypothetical protein BDN72DRAFT_762060 [Pluteus cervinus]